MVAVYFSLAYFFNCAGSILGTNPIFGSLCALPVFVLDESLAETACRMPPKPFSNLFGCIFQRSAELRVERKKNSVSLAA